MKSLQVLGHEVQEDVLLVNPQGHDHKQWNVCVALNDEVGFKWTGDEYELVAYSLIYYSILCPTSYG